MTNKLLIDDETGRVLQADDEVEVSYRYLQASDYVSFGWNQGHGPTVLFVGPDATRRREARRRNQAETGLDAIEYHLTGEGTPGRATLCRVH